MRRQILIVGKHPELAQEFELYSRDPRNAWSAVFVGTAPEALARFGLGDFDVVVAAADTDEVRGLGLLDDIMRSHPHVLRMVISDPADTLGTLKCIGKGHRHLLKPCRLEQLLEALEAPERCEHWRPGEAAQGLIGQMPHLPSPPRIYFQILRALQSPNAWIERIGELIAQDPAVTAKVLQLANSAMLGARIQVVHPREAVAYIGLETTKALVLLAHTFSSFSAIEVSGFSADDLWRHSVTVGRFAKRIARLETPSTGLEEQAFTAGLLHDLGKLLLAENLPKAFTQTLQRSVEENRSLAEMEIQTLGASHAELGACLLSTWGLPEAIVEAVALHHCPDQSASGTFSALAAVHAGNVLAHESWPGSTGAPQAQFHQDYLQRLGLAERVPLWRESCLDAEAK